MTRGLRSIGLAVAVLVGTASSSGTALAASGTVSSAMAGNAAQSASRHHDRHGSGERNGGDHSRQDASNMNSSGSSGPPANCTGGVSSSSDGNAGGTGGTA
jgi:hypothetical protein